MSRVVFDATALSHFARAHRLEVLREVVSHDEPLLLAEVAAELSRGISAYPPLRQVTEADWLETGELDDLSVMAFTRYKGELGGGPDRNNGEAAVLAWVSVNGGIALIDEEVGRAIGRRDKLQVHGSLWLLLRSFQAGTLDRATTEVTVDGLIQTGMRLPVGSGADLFAWAYRTGILQ